MVDIRVHISRILINNKLPDYYYFRTSGQKEFNTNIYTKSTSRFSPFQPSSHFIHQYSFSCMFLAAYTSKLDFPQHLLEWHDFGGFSNSVEVHRLYAGFNFELLKSSGWTEYHLLILSHCVCLSCFKKVGELPPSSHCVFGTLEVQ